MKSEALPPYLVSLGVVLRVIGRHSSRPVALGVVLRLVGSHSSNPLALRVVFRAFGAHFPVSLALGVFVLRGALLLVGQIDLLPLLDPAGRDLTRTVWFASLKGTVAKPTVPVSGCRHLTSRTLASGDSDPQMARSTATLILIDS